jgi:tripartite-type tricarboxylate transporter receptor subunit TctC
VITDLISGQIAMGVVAVTGQSLGFQRTGNLRILAVTSAKPLLAAPELPTTAQAGFPGVSNQSSYGLLAPTGTPKPIIERIAQATRTLLTAREYQQMLIESGFEATPDSSPEEFRRILAADVAFWAPVVKGLGVKID